MTSTRQFQILACPNAFKGSLSAFDAARAIAEGFWRANSASGRAGGRSASRFEVVQSPLADGGDGTLETLVAATGGTVILCNVHGPLGEEVEAAWGRLGGDQSGTAVIEMAKASGLYLLAPEKFDPLNSSTFGTGELMLAAVESGCTRLFVCIGGSATNDGGAGMASALGARLLDARGGAIPPGGVGLGDLAEIDMSGWKLPAGLEVVVACDVDNPLVGPSGASAVYGPQKGASPEMAARLDAALAHFAGILASTFGVDVSMDPGAGAAGGLGAGLRAFCGARLVPGAEMVLEAVHFDRDLDGCSFVVTGEGMLDQQTTRGKVIGAVARRAQAAGKPCIALVGAIKEQADELLAPYGLTAAFSITDRPMDIDNAMRNASTLLSDSAERIARLISGITLIP